MKNSNKAWAVKFRGGGWHVPYTYSQWSKKELEEFYGEKIVRVLITEIKPKKGKRK